MKTKRTGIGNHCTIEKLPKLTGFLLARATLHLKIKKQRKEKN